MLVCNDLNELAREVNRREGKDNCWIFVNMEDWNKSPHSAKFYFADEDEINAMPDEDVFENDTGDLLPVAWKTLGLRTWFESATLHAVAFNAKIPPLPNEDELRRFVVAANHYREYDDFLDYPAQE